MKINEKTRPFLRIVGDTHGKISQLVAIANESEYSICLGDIGFDYTALNAISPDKLKCIAGNHDSYEKWEGRYIKQTPHFLGDFGVYQVPDGPSFFYVRGGRSIDWRYRVEGRDLFQYHEELHHDQGLAAIDMYKAVKPDYVLSHECPASIINHVTPNRYWDGELILPSSTAQLLDSLFRVHAPKRHFFGHHHRNWTAVINGTQFQCLAELSYADFNKGDL